MTTEKQRRFGNWFIPLMMGCFALVAVWWAYSEPPTEGHYNPAAADGAHHTYEETASILKLPKNVDSETETKNEYTEKEIESYVAGRSDLAAQWAMAHYTFVGLIIGLVGIGFIIWTIIETKGAAFFAEQTLKETKLNSERQLRAYLSVQDVKITGKASRPTGPNGERSANDTLIKFNIINSGQTPAYEISTTVEPFGTVDGDISVIVFGERTLNLEGSSQAHNGVPLPVEYEGTDIDFDKLIVTQPVFFLGQESKESRYIKGAKISLIIKIEYFDIFSIGVKNAVKRSEAFLYSQHLPATDSLMWPETMSEREKYIT